jgi:hypothetical protein
MLESLQTPAILYNDNQMPLYIASLVNGLILINVTLTFDYFDACVPLKYIIYPFLTRNNYYILIKASSRAENQLSFI